MADSHETILSVIPGGRDSERLVVSMRVFANSAATTGGDILPMMASATPSTSCCDGCTHERGQTKTCAGSADKPIVLRQESFSAAVGWFTQSCVEMTLDQWSAMKMALTVTIPEPAPTTRTPRRRITAATNSPVILAFDRAASA